MDISQDDIDQKLKVLDDTIEKTDDIYEIKDILMKVIQ